MRVNSDYVDLSKEFVKRSKPNRVLRTDPDTNYDTIISQNDFDKQPKNKFLGFKSSLANRYAADSNKIISRLSFT